MENITIFSDADKNVLASLNLDSIWNKIFETENFDNQSMFPNLEKLVYAVLSLPYSNETEKIFSIVTDVKVKKKNRALIFLTPYAKSDQYFKQKT